MKKIAVAITGGIGSGKTLVAGYLSQKGYPVISADKVAKEILLNDSKVKELIIKEFGSDAYNSKGINTKYLAEKVFNDESKVKQINNIVHPVTIDKINSLIAEYFNKHNIVFVEAALIYEADMEEMFQYIILVYADEDIRLQRAAQRDNVSVEDIRLRQMHQIPDENKKGWADFTIKNNGTLEELYSRTDFVLSLLANISNEQ